MISYEYNKGEEIKAAKWIGENYIYFELNATHHTGRVMEILECVEPQLKRNGGEIRLQATRRKGDYDAFLVLSTHGNEFKLTERRFNYGDRW